ncbi:MAG TPA: LysR family transcriptional regulator [Burkholderiaceae bacterium]|nr:LysR family transcriptional regulator [Burkholderiaceae bacterium]
MKPARPSLNALRAFEATARLRSMSAAGHELSVTHGAISRHIRSLEDVLGVTLLTRTASSSEPTAEGHRLAEGLAAAFKAIDATLEQIKPRPLTLSCSASIMMYWLIPRIADFHRRHPDIQLQFDMNHGSFDAVRDRIGIAIRITMVEPPPDVAVRELGVERIGLVCSPDHLREAKIRSMKDLARARRLSPVTRPGAWAEWSEAAGYRGPALAPQQSFDHFYLMIQAAICGLGICPVPQMLVLDDLRSGKLVAPFGFIDGPHKLVLWLAPHVRDRADTVALERWLTRQLEQTQREGAGITR